MRCRVYLLWYVFLEALPIPLLSSTPTRMFPFSVCYSLLPAFPLACPVGRDLLYLRSQGRNMRLGLCCEEPDMLGSCRSRLSKLPSIRNPSGCIFGPAASCVDEGAIYLTLPHHLRRNGVVLSCRWSKESR